MNKEEFKEQIGKLQIAYNKVFTQEEKRLWYEEFKSISKEEFGRAIDEIIRKDKFAPRISDIKSKISENTYRHYAEDPYAHLYKNLEWCEIVK